MVSDNHDPGDEDRRPDLYCRNCGDPFGPDAESGALCVVQHCQPGAHGTWRPLPKSISRSSSDRLRSGWSHVHRPDTED